MALQRKNFRCPRDGSASPIRATGAGVVVSHAELPPRQRKRLQVGATNLPKPTGDASDQPDALSIASRSVCATNIELLKRTMSAAASGNERSAGEQSSNNAYVIRTEHRQLRSMTPSSSASRLEAASAAARNIRTSHGPRVALESINTNKQESVSTTTPEITKEAKRQQASEARQRKERAAFVRNRKRLYEAFVEKYGSMRAVFKAFDSDGDGVISFQRFASMVEASEVGLTPDETRSMYAFVDTNGDNAMEFQEFAQMFAASEFTGDAGGCGSPDRTSDSDAITQDPSSSFALKYRSPLELSPRSRERMKELRSKVTEQLAAQRGLDVSVHGGKNEQLLMYAFKQFDSDNDGVLTYEQVKCALGKDFLKLQMHAGEMEEMIRMIDRNGDELISMKEFVQYFGVGKREIPTDLLDNGRKKALSALHQKMNAKLTPRDEFDPEYFKQCVPVDAPTEREVVESTGCLPESLSKRIAAAPVFQSAPLSLSSPTRRLGGSKSVPTLRALRSSDGTAEQTSDSNRGPEVNPLTPVSQDRFAHRRSERTDWTRVGLGGDGVVRDSGLFLSDLDRFRTTTAYAYSPMLRGQNSGDLFREQPSTSSVEFEAREKVRHARFERTQAQVHEMELARAKEERLRDWKLRANVRKTAAQKFVYLDRIHEQEQRVAMKDMQTQKRHGGVRYLRMWAGSPDSQFNARSSSSSWTVVDSADT